MAESTSFMEGAGVVNIVFACKIIRNGRCFDAKKWIGLFDTCVVTEEERKAKKKAEKDLHRKNRSAKTECTSEELNEDAVPRTSVFSELLQAVVFRGIFADEPKASMIVYSSGNVIITGFSNEALCRQAAERATETLYRAQE